MITELQVVDKNRACVPWWGTVPWLKRKKVVKFKPGLNILVGPNGSGKSTVLQALGRMTHCVQGGATTVTEGSVHEAFGFISRKDFDPKLSDRERQAQIFKDGLQLVHDGQAVLFADPSKAVGLLGGGAAFDDDFFGEGLLNTMYKGSAGQTTMSRLSDVLGVLSGEVPFPEITWRMHPKRVNGLWRARLEIIEESLAGTIEKGQPTVLMDEPDRSLDIAFQHRFWRRMEEITQKGEYQIIVASHSVFSVNIAGASYIETEKGYLAKCRKGVEWLAKPRG